MECVFYGYSSTGALVLEKESKSNVSDTVKSLVAPAVVGAVVALTNIAVMQSENASVKDAVEKLGQKIDKIDGQVRQLEIEQAKVNTLIANPSLLARG